MKKLQILFLFCIIIVIGACKKVEETSVKVSVFDQNSGTYVPNFKVRLIERYNDRPTLAIGGYFNNYNSYSLKEGETDVNGNFDFGVFEAMKNKKYDYYINEKSISKGIDNKVQLNISGMASLSVSFLPPPPYSPSDSLTVIFRHSYLQYNYYKVTQLGYPSIIGPAPLADGRYYVNIDKFKSGVYINIKDTITLLQNTTTNYNVNW